MMAVEIIKKLPTKMRRQLKAALLIICAAVTFAVPAFGGGYAVMKTEKITSSAASVDGVDLMLVASSAFSEARKAMNASDPDAKDQFINNAAAIVGSSSGSKWQNMGLFLGPKDALSGTAWNTYQTPTTLSDSEVENYGNDGFKAAYEKYKAFGLAIQKLNTAAKSSKTSGASLEEGLDSMSVAALKLGNFGVSFLNKYNPAPVLLSLYDSSNLSTYSTNELVKLVKQNKIMHEIVCLFGDKVGSTGLSFFIILNAVLAVIGLGLSMFLTLLGNQNIGDGIRKFMVRIVVGSVGIYLIANLMSVMLSYVGETVLSMDTDSGASYIETNLNFYDWYQTGFSLPSDVTLEIDSSGNFVFDADIIKKINKYTYKRLTGHSGTAKQIRERMENYDENMITASFVTPTYKAADGGEEWATDVYYAIMDNFANNTDLMEGSDNESSALHQYTSRNFSPYLSRYLWMSGLSMTTRSAGGWKVTMPYSSYNYYGLNPISALNMLRTEFSGNNIVAKTVVYPWIGCVAFDAINVVDYASESTHMNSILRFIAVYTIVMAALKGMITIFTAGFGGMLSGGIKTATGSAHGLGQAIGAIIALFGGLIGISVILSVTMTLLDALYGIAHELLSSNEILDTILQPIEDAVGEIPFIGDLVTSICRSIVGFILTLVMSLTFPKLGGIPITTFCQFMADIPGRVAERAQMVENMIMSGRSSAGSGLGHRGGSGGGGYGKVAGAQAAQANASAQKQAALVVTGLAGAGAALTGAGLSKAGKSLNNKADAVEGKPQNPGMDNWNEMSPEEQTAAAAAAAEMGDDWNNLDQDAKEKAMEERMNAQENAAQEASFGGGTQNGAGQESENTETPNDIPPAVSDFDHAESASAESETSGMETASADGVGAVSSITAGEEASVSGTEADNESYAGESEDDVSSVMGINESASVSGEPSESTGSGGAPTEMGTDSSLSGDESITNLNNEQETAHVEQNVGNNLSAVSEDRSMDASNVTEEAGSSIDGTESLDESPNAPNGGMGMSPEPLSNMNPVGADDINAAAGSIDDKAGFKMSDAAAGKNASVNGTSKPSNVHASHVDQSKSSTVNHNSTLGSSNGPGSQNASGMNGTSRSAWGKDMSVADQRKARVLHAMGDGLQAMGGNRTLGDGLKDAAGHLRDTGFAYTMPDAYAGSLFVSSLRSSRKEQQARRQQNARSKDKK